MPGLDKIRAALPSNINFYHEFNSSTEECGRENSCDTEMNSYSFGNNDYDKCREPIKKALAYLLKTYPKNKKPYNKEAYHFFYYWLGDTLSGCMSNKHMFQSKVDGACGTIDKYCEESGVCGLPYDDKPVQEQFFHRKTLYDYWYDHTMVRALVEFSGSQGLEICKSYLENVKAAKDAMELYCTESRKQSDKYCRNFWEPHKENIKEALRGVNGALTTAQGTIVSEAQAASLQAEANLNQAVHSATTASSLSSIIGTLATIGAPFLLYKYDLLPSWISSTLRGKNGRKKRTTVTMGHNQFDDSTLTETSTIGPTTENDSTDLSTTTVDHSTTLRPTAPYTRPSSRGERRNNNAGGHGMVGYQNM